jgi:hypothetical protein
VTGGKVKSSEGSSACQICPAGTYSLAAATACEVCPAESASSPEGSASLVECRPPVVVKVVLTLALSTSEFTEAKERQFLQGIANAAGVEVGNVKVIGIKPQSRRLLKSGIILDVAISTPDKSAARSVAAQLTVDKINVQMAKVSAYACTPHALQPNSRSTVGGIVDTCELTDLTQLGLPEVVVVQEPEMSSVLPSPVQASGSSNDAGKAVQTVSCRMIYLFAADGLEKEEASEKKVGGVWVSGTCVSGLWIAAPAGVLFLLCCCCCAGCCYRRYLRMRLQTANSRFESLLDTNEIAMTSLPSAPDTNARGSRQPAAKLDDSEASRRPSQSAPTLPAPASQHSAAADEVQIEMIQMDQQGQNAVPAQENLNGGVFPSFPFEVDNMYSRHTLPERDSGSNGIVPTWRETAAPEHVSLAARVPSSISRGQRHMLQQAVDKNQDNLPNIQPMEPPANEAPDVWAMFSASLPPVRSVPLRPAAPFLQPNEPAATSASFNPFSDES